MNVSSCVSCMREREYLTFIPSKAKGCFFFKGLYFKLLGIFSSLSPCCVLLYGIWISGLKFQSGDNDRNASSFFFVVLISFVNNQLLQTLARLCYAFAMVYDNAGARVRHSGRGIGISGVGREFTLVLVIFRSQRVLFSP